MRRVLIDTITYTAFKRNRADIVEAFRNLDFIGIDVTVLGELLSGFAAGRIARRNRKELEQFINNPRVKILNHNINTAEFYAQLYKNLRAKGKPIPTNDMWIAATALQHGLAVFSLDSHFKEISGLAVKEDF